MAHAAHQRLRRSASAQRTRRAGLGCKVPSSQESRVSGKSALSKARVVAASALPLDGAEPALEGVKGLASPEEGTNRCRGRPGGAGLEDGLAVASARGPIERTFPVELREEVGGDDRVLDVHIDRRAVGGEVIEARPSMAARDLGEGREAGDGATLLMC